MKVIQIGNGGAAKMHRQCFPEEVSAVAVIDTDSKKREQAEKEGLLAFPDINSVSHQVLGGAELWDICVPDEHHFSAMKAALEKGAMNILVEKPICPPSQIEAMRDWLNGLSPEVKVCVEETYASSLVARVVKSMSQLFGLKRPAITVEQSKNRMADILAGRFIDKELGVFALEVPHSLTIVNASGENRLPLIIQEVSLDDMILPSGEILPRQGKGKIVYSTQDGCQVTILSAMNGEILHPLLEVDAPAAIPLHSPLRYRIMVMEENGYRIIGQFEPIHGQPRFTGQVMVCKEKVLKINAPFIEDKPMNEHISAAIQYFKGERKNPGSPTEALLIVKFLREAMEKLGH